MKRNITIAVLMLAAACNGGSAAKSNGALSASASAHEAYGIDGYRIDGDAVALLGVDDAEVGTLLVTTRGPGEQVVEVWMREGGSSEHELSGPAGRPRHALAPDSLHGAILVDPALTDFFAQHDIEMMLASSASSPLRELQPSFVVTCSNMNICGTAISCTADQTTYGDGRIASNAYKDAACPPLTCSSNWLDRTHKEWHCLQPVGGEADTSDQDCTKSSGFVNCVCNESGQYLTACHAGKSCSNGSCVCTVGTNQASSTSDGNGYCRVTCLSTKYMCDGSGPTGVLGGSCDTSNSMCQCKSTSACPW